MTITLKNAEETRALGAWLAEKVSGGDVVSLEGPLGAGKTTLLQALTQELGFKSKTTSPTFILFRVLPVTGSAAKRRSIKQVVHADAYRVKDPAELVATGFTEYVGQPDTLTVVEWGDRVSAILPKSTLRIKLEPSQDIRKAIISARLGKPRFSR